MKNLIKLHWLLKLGENKVKVYHNILVLGAIILSGIFCILYYTSPYNLIFIITYMP